MIVPLLSFTKNNPFSNRQHNVFEMSSENKEKQKLNIIWITQRDMGLSSSEGNRNYFRISPKCNELSDRSGF